MSDESGEEWEELLPDNGDHRLSFVFDWFDMAMYREPTEIDYWNGVLAGMGLTILPVVVLGPLAVGALAWQLYTGALTWEAIMAMLSARPEPMTTREIAIQIISSWLNLAIVMPPALGAVVLYKTLVGLKRQVRGGGL